jgi:hypothetical protein
MRLYNPLRHKKAEISEHDNNIVSIRPKAVHSFDSVMHIFTQPYFGHSFDQIGIQHPTSLPIIQPKLAIGQLNDTYEQPNPVADRFMTRPAPDLRNHYSPTDIQRCAKCGENHDAVGAMCADCAASAPEETLLQRYAVEVAPSVTSDIENRNIALQGEQQFDLVKGAFMSPRFGHDFGQVRVHTNERAVEAAHSVNVVASTIGNDMLFGMGHHQPGINDGQRLIVNRLPHIGQQGKDLVRLDNDSGVTLQRQSLVSKDRSYSEDCTKYINFSGSRSCEFYQCRESNADYSGLSQGYYIKYGLKYCALFSEQLKPILSSAGKSWVDRTRRLLMLHVQQNIPWDANPEEVRRSAFNSHPDCYVRGGICMLPPSDLIKIVRIIDTYDHDLAQLITTVITCIGSYSGLSLPATSLGVGGGYSGLMERDRREAFNF